METRLSWNSWRTAEAPDTRLSSTCPSGWRLLLRMFWARSLLALRSFIDVSVYSTAHGRFGKSSVTQRRREKEEEEEENEKKRDFMDQELACLLTPWPFTGVCKCEKFLWKNKAVSLIEEVKSWRKWDTGRLKMICWNEEAAFWCFRRGKCLSFSRWMDESVLSEREGFFKNLLENFTRRSRKRGPCVKSSLALLVWPLLRNLTANL